MKEKVAIEICKRGEQLDQALGFNGQGGWADDHVKGMMYFIFSLFLRYESYIYIIYIIYI